MSAPLNPDATGDPPPLDWSRMPRSVSAWLRAGLFNAAGLPQPTSAAWLIAEAPPPAVFGVTHIGVASCLATHCPEGPAWLDLYGSIAGEQVRSFVEAGDPAELAAAHDDLDAILRTFGHELMQPGMVDRLNELRRAARA